MALYHFNIRTASHIATTLPVERNSLTDLRREMAVFVGDTLRDHADEIWIDQDWQFDVTDERGLILYVIHIAAAESAATTGSLPSR